MSIWLYVVAARTPVLITSQMLDYASGDAFFIE